MRRWHTWGGLAAALFLVIVGASGVILNYKPQVFSALGLERMPLKSEKPPKPNKQLSRIELSTTQDLGALPLGFEYALQIARKEWGSVRLERIELKSEHGETLFKIKQAKGEELWINAATGESFRKGAYEKVAKAGAGGPPMRRTDWGKLLLDLHTGKLGGAAGKAFMSLAAVLLIFLSLSGVYMWAKPLLIRRKNKVHKRDSVAQRSPPARKPSPTLVPAREEVGSV
jgi:uncharacterized iron-regulated membrane protein